MSLIYSFYSVSCRSYVDTVSTVYLVDHIDTVSTVYLVDHKDTVSTVYLVCNLDTVSTVYLVDHKDTVSTVYLVCHLDTGSTVYLIDHKDTKSTGYLVCHLDTVSTVSCISPIYSFYSARICYIENLDACCDFNNSTNILAKIRYILYFHLRSHLFFISFHTHLLQNVFTKSNFLQI